MPDTRSRRRAAVFGSPVAHSLSPVLHTSAYAVCGLSQWTYERREVTVAEFAGVVASLDDSWRGLSLTMPLKEVAFTVADTVTDVARRAGAINTLVRRAEGGWDATNTDVAGIACALRPYAQDALHRRGGTVTAQVIGSGATARSAVLALADLGVSAVQVAARHPGRAGEVAALAHSVGLAAGVVGLEAWIEQPADLIVSTLPPPASAPLAEAVRPGSALAGTVLLDVVYANWPTPLATAFAAASGEVVSGLEMLVHQGAAQFELFTGVRAPVAAMRDAAWTALRGG